MIDFADCGHLATRNVFIYPQNCNKNNIYGSTGKFFIYSVSSTEKELWYYFKILLIYTQNF